MNADSLLHLMLFLLVETMHVEPALENQGPGHVT